MKPADTETLLKLQKQFKNGAGWFYWIAGLSVVNSVIFFMEGNMTFIVGLGITQIISAIGAELAKEFGQAAKYVMLMMEIIAAGMFALFGYFANKRYRWAFIIGMVLYALDSLIFLAVQEWLSFGFHLFALFGLYVGLRGEWRLRQFELVQQGAAPAELAPPLAPLDERSLG